MGLVGAVLAVCAGMYLAALEHPRVCDKVRVERIGVALLVAAAACLSVVVVQVVRSWMSQ
ncbi:hypothetical protein [Couchioplanes caeruleus]|nr:hypothetical protein [Couchioplanes caeruleus]ROP33778.1 hypothetical protein EDD30_6819 [Couchioplanes caeruleus]